MNLVVSEALLAHVTNRGKARPMLAIDVFGKRSRFSKTLVTKSSLPNYKISGELNSWDKCRMYWPLWTCLVVAMHDDIENTSVGTDPVRTVIYQSIALQTGARLA